MLIECICHFRLHSLFILLDEVVKEFHSRFRSIEGRIVISLGSGVGAMEMSSSTVCLCIDKDRRSVFAGIVNMMGNRCEKNKMMYHCYFDYTVRLDYLLSKLKALYVTNDIIVLFQHPSPAMGDRDSFAMAGKHCILSLLQGQVERIYFVYDVNHRKESVCWSYEEMKNCFFSKVCLKKKDKDGIDVSKDLIIS